MSAIKVRRDHFQGNSHIHGRGANDLAAIIRGVAIDLATQVLKAGGVTALTDSSGGTAATAVADLITPTSAFDATSAGGAQNAALNTALGKIENAGKVLVNSFNVVRAKIGLPVMSAASGTEASANTIPSQDTSVTTSSGTSAVDYDAGKAALEAAKRNMRKLVDGLNDILAATGMTPLSSSLTGDYDSGEDLEDVPAGTASATGALSVSKALADAFLLAHANNLATIAAAFNAFQVIMGGFSGISDLTDSSGGSASNTLAAFTVPTPAAGAATTSSPKAGFDTALGVIENNQAEIATRMNVIRGAYGLAKYTDSTGQTTNGTLESQSVNLTAVDGSSGTSAVEPVSGLARLATIRDNTASLAAGINELCDFFGLVHLTNNNGGTASTTIANIAATATGVGGQNTLLDTEVDAALSVIRDNLSSLAAKLNAMTGSGAQIGKPLHVVAA